MNINYIRSGDYFIPDLKLPEETRTIGKWGRMHREHLKEHHPIQYNFLVLSGKFWTHLADLNEQAQQRMETLIAQLKTAEGILKRTSTQLTCSQSETSPSRKKLSNCRNQKKIY